MIVVVGLGNPGRRYHRTRHNAGFRVVDVFTRTLDVTFSHTEKDHADIAEARIGRETCLIVKPQTFMNASGEAVLRIIQRVGRKSPRLIVIYDDKDLPFGTIRIRKSGSSGGHRGVQSIIDHLGQDFTRIRIGVANEQLSNTDTEHFVLEPFTSEEEAQFPSVIQSAIEQLETAITKK